jgi:hypothetical protein
MKHHSNGCPYKPSLFAILSKAFPQKQTLPRFPRLGGVVAPVSTYSPPLFLLVPIALSKQVVHTSFDALDALCVG